MHYRGVRPSFCRAVAIAVVMVAAASSGFSQSWVDFATVSMTNATTPKLSNRYVCFSDGANIACNAPSLYLSTGGLVGINTTAPNAELDVYGTISATNFVGDGSGLTGVVASTGDRIVSGSTGGTRMVAISNTGFISITQAGANSGWFDPTRGLITLGVSSTGPISGTNGYFTEDVRIGTNAGSVLFTNSTGVSDGGIRLNPSNNLEFESGIGSGFRFLTNNGNNERVTILSNGNVGLGTVTPTATLQVSGSMIVSVSGQTTTPTLYVGTNGRVGVGTAAPGVALHVVGDVRMESDAGIDVELVLRGVNGGGSVISDYKFRHVNASDAFALVRNGTEHLRMTNGGRFGLGTATPIAKLDVLGTISASDAIQVGTSALGCSAGIPGAIRYNSGSLQYCNGTSWTTLGTSAGVTGTGSATAVAYWSGASGLTYDADGFYWDATNNRLGIGLANPSTSLHVIGNAWIEGPGGGAMLLSGTMAGVMFYDRQAGAGVSALYRQMGKTRFWESIGGDRMVLDNSTGYFGIATQSPTATLQVSGSMIVSVTGQTTTPTLYVGSDGRVRIGGVAAGSGMLTVVSATNPEVMVWVETGGASQSASLRLVGSNAIGTTSQDTRLVSYQPAGGAAGDTAFDVRVRKNGDAFGAPSTVLTVLGQGRVGVGRTLPIGNLDVLGTISASDAVQVGTSALGCSAGIPGAIRYNSGSLQYCNGTSWTTLGTSAGVTGTGSATAVAYWSGASGLTYDADGFYWDATNNRLGIGTNSPTAGVHVFNGTSHARARIQTAAAASSAVLDLYNVAQSSELGVYGGAGGDKFRIYHGGDWRFAIDTSGNVGIGTQSPTASLQIVSTSAGALTNPLLLTNNSTSANSEVELRFAPADAPTIRYAAISSANNGSNQIDLRFKTGFGADILEKMRITALGNVGIATQSPTATLQVSGSMIVSVTGQTTTPTLYVGTNGQVGIGTSAPGALLDMVSGNSAAYLLATSYRENVAGGGVIVQHSRGTSGVPLALQTGDLTGVLAFRGYDGSSFEYTSQIESYVDGVPGDGDMPGGMRFRTTEDGTGTAKVRMTINNLGNVGISVTNPTAKLDVGGTISASDAIQVGDSALTCTAGIPGALRYNGGSLQYCNGTSWTTLGTSAGVTGTGSATAVAFWSVASGLTYDADGFYWDPTNNRLGIGTNTPTSALDISSSGTAQQRLYSSALNAFSVMRFSNPSRTIEWALAGPSAGANKDSLYVYDSTSSTTRMLIDPRGNVGIGTTAPNATLQVSGTLIVSTSVQNTTPSLYVHSDGNVGIGTVPYSAALHVVSGTAGQTRTFAAFGHANDSWAAAIASFGNETLFELRNSGDWTPKIRLRTDEASFFNGGNVGISISTPKAKLDVVGTISASDAIQVGDSTLTCTAGIPGALRYNGGSLQYCNGTTWTTVSGGAGSLTGTGSATAVAFWSSASDLTYDADGFYWNATNNRLGIGTDAPGYPLHVSTSAGGGMAAFRTAASGANTYIAVGNGGTTHTVGVDVDNVAYGFTSGAYKIFTGGANERFRIASGGNFGIGTQSPTATLQISGSMIVSVTGQTATPTLNVGANGNIAIGTALTGNKLTVGGVIMISGGSPLTSDVNNDLRLQSQAATIWNIADYHVWLNKTSAREYMRVNNTGNIGISTSTPLAKLDVNGTISASDAIQVGDSSLTCSTGIKGAIRYSNTSNTLEYCNSVTWVPTGNITDTSLTAFSVTKSSAQTGIASGGVVTWDAAVTNNGGAFNLATERFTAPVNGYYYFVVSILTGNDATAGDFKLYKNAVATDLRAYGSNGITGYKPAIGQGVLYLAAGDYVDVRSMLASQSAYGTANASVSTFSGFLLNAGATGSGGGASTLNDLTDVNTSGAAAGNVLRYDGANWVVSTTATALGDRITSGTAPTAVIVNSATSYISLTTGATTWGYLSSANSYLTTLTASQLNTFGAANGLILSDRTVGNGATQFYRVTSKTHVWDGVGGNRVTLDNVTGALGISNTAPIAKLDVRGTISASDAIQVSGSSLTCSIAIEGAIRYSNTSSTIEYCQGTAWVSMGPSATDVPAFRVHRNGSNQAVTTNTDTAIDWTTEEFDTTNAFNLTTDRFQPLVAGMYILTGVNYCTSATTQCTPRIYKNGSLVALGAGAATNGTTGSVSTIVYLNGSTDYVELHAFSGGGTSISGASYYTNFSGALIASGNGLAGGGGGSANPAGGAGDIQFNDGSNLAADTGQLFWDATNNRLGIGTGSPASVLHVSGTVAVSGSDLILDNGKGLSSAKGARLSTGPAGDTFIVSAGSGAGASIFAWNTSASVPVGTIKATGNMGIGTVNPYAMLDVVVSDTVGVDVQHWRNNYGGADLYLRNETGGRFVFNTELAGGGWNTLALYGPYVGIGTVTPTTNLDVSGSIAYSGIITDLSDRRTKTNIKPITSSLEQLLKLKPVTFWMRDNPIQKEYGFIAQDVEPLFPELVKTANDPSGTKSLNYIGLIAPTIKAVQELKADNDNLRRKLEAANDNTQTLRREVDAMRNELRQLKQANKK